MFNAGRLRCPTKYRDINMHKQVQRIIIISKCMYDVEEMLESKVHLERTEERENTFFDILRM